MERQLFYYAMAVIQLMDINTNCKFDNLCNYRLCLTYDKPSANICELMLPADTWREN